ncbi:hypothetical protein SDC9_74990 [bioreactor metagenome]|uniref:Uncharacterized protein n=1 Tax=bioreactor metagenome TaxID=1076179 RepID=A0A644YQT9_9ZZZZ
MERADNRTGITVKAVFRAVISDLADRLADNCLEVEMRLGRNFPHYHDKSGRSNRFACHTRADILS